MRALTRLSPEVDPLYVAVSRSSAHGEFLTRANIRCLSAFLGPLERAARREGRHVAYTPTQYTHASRSIRVNGPPNYFIFRAAPDGRARPLQSLPVE